MKEKRLAVFAFLPEFRKNAKRKSCKFIIKFDFRNDFRQRPMEIPLFPGIFKLS